ncbi:Transposase and inactivated derivatives [Citrobacter werkmanii]|nr:Transposase and inactivated derivatives [Citrobacter werkmanii]
MNSLLPDDIDELKRLLAEQEALNRALLEKLNEREREIDHLQAQLDKLRRMNFGSRSEKSPAVSRRWKPTLSSCRKKAIPLPAGWMTRPCSARCGRPVPANRSLNHFP